MRYTTRLVAGLSAVMMAGCASASHSSAPTPVMVPMNGRVVYGGVVQDVENFQRLQGVTVEISLVGDSNKPFAIAATDEKGEFAFSGLDPGAYMLHIGRPGYNETRMRIEATGNETKPLDVRLRSLRQRCVASRYHTLECP